MIFLLECRLAVDFWLEVEADEEVALLHEFRGISQVELVEDDEADDVTVVAVAAVTGAGAGVTTCDAGLATLTRDEFSFRLSRSDNEATFSLSTFDDDVDGGVGTENLSHW